jgi:hypothetical protein
MIAPKVIADATKPVPVGVSENSRAMSLMPNASAPRS